MAKVVYKTKEKSVWLSYPETILLLIEELGSGFLDAFLPRKYPETHLTRRLIGLDTIKPKQIYLAKHRLKQRGLIARAGTSYRITPRGIETAQRLRELFGSFEKRWDGKWRMVIFDIPEKMKSHRDTLRYVLAGAGYQRLQDSVWIGKESLGGDVIKMIDDWGINKCVYFFHIDDTEEIQRYFDSLSDS